MDVVFAVMPFADVGRPAIGVSLLDSEIREAGFSSRVEYLNLALAERIGLPLYNRLSNSLPSDTLIGEWFFADVVFGEDLPQQNDYISKILSPYVSTDTGFLNDLRAARECRAAFIDSCIERIMRSRPKVVGFTTTFHQTCPCLAVARGLKELPDAPIVIFGGANCEGEMGLQLIQSFPWIDAVCSGEADVSFPALLASILRGIDTGEIPGVLRQGSSVRPAAPQPVREMDRLPFPNFDDYFEQVEASPLRAELRVELVVETSRGCWWGAKQHCTFCGLNGDTMTFRSKSPERAFEEFSHLARRYGVKKIECVDNILDTNYIKSLFPKLKESGLNLDLFYEVKANLRHEQLATMRDGGVHAIQPGIESFSNQVLRLMRKGCTGIQNIQLLRWCEEIGIQVAWNILAGFPRESPEEYEQMTEYLPLLAHLAPPASCTPVRLDRFSPFFARPEEFGFQRLRPARAYYYVFPLGRAKLLKLAYFFEFDYDDGRDPWRYLRSVQQEMGRWWEQRMAEGDERAALDAQAGADEITISDTRRCAVVRSLRLAGLEARIYLLCDSGQSFASVLRRCRDSAEEPAVRTALRSLKESKLLIELDGQYLSLAVFRSRPPSHFRGQDHVNVPVQETTSSQSLLRVV